MSRRPAPRRALVPGHRRLLVGVLAAVLSTVLLAGCVSLPDSGPVVEDVRDADPSSAPGAYYVPSGPQPGETANEIVRHFLEAMTAAPVQTGVAREFLASEGAAEWEPEQETITYSGPLRPTFETLGATRVQLELPEAQHLDRRGSWRGPLPASEALLDFPMVRQDGEWRIADAPDALIVPESWFDDRFRQVSLYFFDPSAEILVPEPIFVPNGDQLATTLVRRLVEGPGPELAGVSRTFLPRETSPELSIDVRGGVAQVDLQGEVASSDFDTAGLFLAQVAWTLRQDPDIETFRLTLQGEPLRLPDGTSEVPVTYGVQYSPAVSASSDALFGLVEGALVELEPGSGPVRVRGPLGSQAYGVRDVAVDLLGEQVVAVDDDGGSLLLSAVEDPDAVVRTVLDGGDDLAKPSWDFTGRLWTLDRTGEGARIVVVTGGDLEEVRVPGVTGRQVTRSRVSRDASRLVSVVRTPAGDRVLVNRIRYDDAGDVTSFSPPLPVLVGGTDPLRVVDVGWSSPTSVAVVERISQGIWTSYDVPVDGSRRTNDDQSSISFDRERVRRLAAAPDEDLPTYLVTADGATAVGEPGFDQVVAVGVAALTYVG